ncbi:MAG: CYTH domain-containing protein [Verrucomicrobiota bacterium]
MPLEIERKFIAHPSQLPAAPVSTRLEQGYVDMNRATVRVRVSGDQCFLTIKGPSNGMSRLEFEYPIPLEQGQEMLRQLCRKPIIEKTRHEIKHGKHCWEVDVFDGENRGLVVAEVELDHEEESVELPAWVQREVTDDPKYANAALAERPFSQWTIEEKAAT